MTPKKEVGSRSVAQGNKKKSGFCGCQNVVIFEETDWTQTTERDRPR